MDGSSEGTRSVNVKYEKGEPPEWHDGVEALQVQQVPGPKGSWTYEIIGPCPRCKHELRKDISYLVGPAVALPSIGEKLVVRVVCNCTCPHEGAPAETTGCGAEGGVELDFT